jgi:hypothetical protein
MQIEAFEWCGMSEFDRRKVSSNWVRCRKVRLSPKADIAGVRNVLEVLCMAIIMQRRFSEGTTIMAAVAKLWRDPQIL